jgi:MFS family permease
LDRIAGCIPRESSCRSFETPATVVTRSEICSLSGCSSGGTHASTVRNLSPTETSRCWAPSCKSLVGLLAAAILIGTGVGVITPISFAYLTITTPQERLGQTLGAAEIGRELGDAGGPLLAGCCGARQFLDDVVGTATVPAVAPRSAARISSAG